MHQIASSPIDYLSQELLQVLIFRINVLMVKVDIYTISTFNGNFYLSSRQYLPYNLSKWRAENFQLIRGFLDLLLEDYIFSI